MYKTRRNALRAELSNVWGVDDAFKAEYAEDYQLLTSDSGSDNITVWRDKYTTIILMTYRYSLPPLFSLSLIMSDGI